MNKLALIAIALAALATAPAVAADYVHTRVWEPTPGAYALTPALDFTINANAGDTIVATVSYFTDIPIDMGLRILAPGQSCTILDPNNPPGTDVPCLAGQTVNTCPPTNPDPIATSTEGALSRTLVATTSGAHKVSVSAELNTASSIFFSLSISVNGGTPSVAGPVATNYVNRGVVCKALP